MKNMKHKYHLALIAGGLAIVAGLFTGLRAENRDEEPGYAPQTRNVAVMKVARTNVERTTTYPGKVYAFAKSILTFRVSGPLREICVEPGDVVKKGDKLMQIDPRDYIVRRDSAQAGLDAAKAKLEAMEKGSRPEDIALLETSVAQAEASYQLAKNEFERFKKLIETHAVSDSEYDMAYQTYVAAGLAVNSAKKELEKGKAGSRKEDILATKAEIRGLEAALRSAENDLADTTLLAPYDGVITTRMIENYEMVTVSPTYREVLGIHDISRLKIDIYVPEKEMVTGKLVKGISGSVRFTACPDRTFEAKLYEIDTQPTDVGMTYKLTFVLDAPREIHILPGMVCELSLPDYSSQPAQDVLVVPSESVVNHAVWVVDSNTSVVSRRLVSCGALVANDQCIVTSGLNEGEEIVTQGARYLHDGEKIAVK
ncbi:MAG: efflux RND transporter periplasmic adaptor subunit [Planctomycetia bacterium]|nr:efflux RND transporter periplasmic adaptor subunit [Planctomycetia bacterium]